ncbi:MAG: hypothetical protein FWG98_09735 [Candidatus Cloacimonetes bacterium]|nr:hypothetical protein [Candidatus Cloacimonadota bacterium]
MNKIANYLRVTGIVVVISTGIGIILMGTGIYASIFEELIGETVKTSGVTYAIQGLVNIFSLYVSIMMIKNSHIFEKASHLKKLAISYLIVVIVSTLILIPENQKLGNIVTGADIAMSVIISCIIPTLCIIFTSKIEKMHLQSNED